MLIHITHAIVLTHEEAEDMRKRNESFDFDDVSFGDYIVHAFYCENTEELIYLEDNIPERPGETLEGFEIGITAAGGVMEVNEIVLILPEGANSCSHSHVLNALREVVK